MRRNGSIVSIDSKELVVGDALLFNIGDAFMVDGIMTEGSNVMCDESALTGETDEVKKSPLFLDSPEESKISPFLISGTNVMDGQGIMLVLSVG